MREYEASESGTPAHTTWRSIIRPRTIVYFTLWTIAGLAILYSLMTRDRLQLSVLHDRNPQYVQLSDGSIRNGYTVKILNMELRDRTFRVRLNRHSRCETVYCRNRCSAVHIPAHPNLSRPSAHGKNLYHRRTGQPQGRSDAL